VLLGKFFGCWLASGLALLVFYIFFALVSASREHSLPFGNYFQAFWMHWQMLGVVVALTLWGSIALSTPAANVTIVFIVSLGILFLGQHLHTVAMGVNGFSSSLLDVIYYSIPHLEFFDLRNLIIHDWPLVGWAYIGAATVYAWAYAAVFLIGACLAFRRKALN
jgi:hypothetical protein